MASEPPVEVSESEPSAARSRSFPAVSADPHESKKTVSKLADTDNAPFISVPDASVHLDESDNTVSKRIGPNDAQSNSVLATRDHSNETVKTVLKRTDLPATVEDQNAAHTSVSRALSAAARRIVTGEQEAAVFGRSASPSSLPSIHKEATTQKATFKTEPVTEAIIPSPAAAMESREQCNIKSEQLAQLPDSKAQYHAIKSEQLSQVPPKTTLKGLRGIADSMNLAKLEAGVAIAQVILGKLRVVLEDFQQDGDHELRRHLTDIISLISKAVNAGRTVIAVAGGTGAGKSSLINALLDERKLLPTNGVRACTAVITEISYNKIDDPQHAYCAVIDFISFDDWLCELEHLLDDLVHAGENNQSSQAWKDASSDLGIAYAKVKAVYPDLTHDQIIKSKPEGLARIDAVKRVLGTERKSSYCTAEALYTDLSTLIDSKEKGSRQGNGTNMAYWPLIRVVKIFTRAPVLSTGVVLCDLPGVADNNPARNAVANRYMAECNTPWIVAPIRRAVDDKAAMELLGRSSRIQMKLDGAYSHLTFIASQTDGINIQETMDTLDYNGHIRDTFAREEQVAQMIDQEKLGMPLDQQQQIEELNAACDSLYDELDLWQLLRKAQEKGKPVFAPAAKRATVQPKRRRTARYQLPTVDDSGEDESDMVPLTKDEISVKLAELEAAFEAKSNEVEAAEKQYEDAKRKIELLQEQKADIAIDRARMCMETRNDYCRNAIREDFAEGIRAIDEENSEFDSLGMKRDYDEVARSLPVFCISSKAYQQLCKTTRGETKLEGFRSVEDSEIPGLQNHAKMSARAGQIRSNKAFLNQVSSVMNSLTLWSTSGERSMMSEKSKDYELKRLEAHLQKLKSSFEDIVSQTKRELSDILHEDLGAAFSKAMTHASYQLMSLVARWSTSESEGGYGLMWQTYRATCKRHGEKTASKKARNFNEDVADPFLQNIAAAWEQAFTKTIPAVLDKFATVFIKQLRDFHNLIASRPELQKSRSEELHKLASQIEVHEAILKDTINNAKIQIIAGQRNSSRLVIPEIKEELKTIYEQCAAVKGPRTYARMTEAKTLHFENNKVAIYTIPWTKVKKGLEGAFQTIADILNKDCGQIRVSMAADYKGVLTSAEKVETHTFVHGFIKEILQTAEHQFDAVLAGEEPMEVDQSAVTAVPADTAPVPQLTPSVKTGV